MISEIAPLISAMVRTREKNVRTVQQAIVDNAWIHDVQGDLSFMAHMQVANLCQAVATVPIIATAPDQFIWLVDASGCYTAKSVYNRLCLGLLASPTARCIWKSWAPCAARFLPGSWCSIGCGQVIDARVMVSKMSLPPASPVFRRLIVWTTFLPTVPMPERSDIDALMLYRLTCRCRTRRRSSLTGGCGKEEDFRGKFFVDLTPSS